jgi:hypothetical protein
VAFPALRLDQHNPRCLHEQDAQIAIAALGYPAQDRAACPYSKLGMPEKLQDFFGFRHRP